MRTRKERRREGAERRWGLEGIRKSERGKEKTWNIWKSKRMGTDKKKKAFDRKGRRLIGGKEKSV